MTLDAEIEDTMRLALSEIQRAIKGQASDYAITLVEVAWKLEQIRKSRAEMR